MCIFVRLPNAAPPPKVPEIHTLFLSQLLGPDTEPTHLVRPLTTGGAESWE